MHNLLLLVHPSFQHTSQLSKGQVWSYHNLCISEMNLHCLHKLIPALLTSKPYSSPILCVSSHQITFQFLSTMFSHCGGLCICTCWVRSVLSFLAIALTMQPSGTCSHHHFSVPSLSILPDFPIKTCAPSPWTLDFLYFLDRRYLDSTDFILLFMCTALGKFAEWINK